jgi:hypothetical protein
MATSPNDAGLLKCLAFVDEGRMRVDPELGMVFCTYTTSLYTYERPIGALNTLGYVVLSTGANGGKRRGDNPQVYAHRLIWAVATGEMPTYPLVINHKNGVKRDNRIANLELTTQAGNVRHAYQTGLIKAGEDRADAKLTNEDIRRIYALQFSESSSVGETADRYGVCHSLVSTVRSGYRRGQVHA